MPRKGAPWSLATCRPASNRGLTPNTGSLFRRKPQRRRRRMTTMMSRPVFSSSFTVCSARSTSLRSSRTTSQTSRSTGRPSDSPCGIQLARKSYDRLHSPPDSLENVQEKARCPFKFFVRPSVLCCPCLSTSSSKSRILSDAMSPFVLSPY